MKTLLPFLLALTACSSAVKKYDYPTTAKADVEAQQLDAGIQRGYVEQLDVLAQGPFKKSQHEFERAKSATLNSDQFWTHLGWSHAYLVRAEKLGQRRREFVRDVLSAREKALAAKAQVLPKASKELLALDNIFRANSRDLDLSRNDKMWDRARTDYERLEVHAIQEVLLAQARAEIDAAKGDRVSRYAPIGYRAANAAVAAAEKEIELHPHDPSAYKDAVAHANQLASLLPPITEQARKAAHSSYEKVGQELVTQQRDLASLRQELKGAEAESSVKQKAIVAKEEELRSLAEKTNRLAREQSFDDTLQNAQRQFDPKEAEVYRQNDKLVIRLKEIRFAPGKADLPARAIPLLNKVKSVIKDLDAQDIVIQGHTDATGSFALNKRLSNLRAKVIAQYVSPDAGDAKIKTQALAYLKPLATDKTAVGRAENRRVDVILTPKQY